VGGARHDEGLFGAHAGCAGSSHPRDGDLSARRDFSDDIGGRCLRGGRLGGHRGSSDRRLGPRTARMGMRSGRRRSDERAKSESVAAPSLVRNDTRWSGALQLARILDRDHAIRVQVLPGSPAEMKHCLCADTRYSNDRSPSIRRRSHVVAL